MYNGWISEYDGRPLPKNRVTPKRMLLAALLLGLLVVFASVAGAKPKPGTYRPVVYDPPGAIDTLTYVDKLVASPALSPQRLAWYRLAMTLGVRL